MHSPLLTPTVFCCGLSHQSASVDIREKYSLAPAQEAISAALTLNGVSEAVVLSTCNRAEIYAVATPGTIPDLMSVFMAGAKANPADARFFYQLDAENAASHLFRVASGMESMVLGETEIFGQVKQAYADSASHGAVSKILNRLFQKAFQVGKQVRSRTGITRGSVSVGSVAVDLAERIFGNLGNCHVMIMGAGDTSEKTARALLSRGARGIFVSNRSFERAADLAASLAGEAIHFDQWEERLHCVDIVISSTSAPHYVVRHDQVKRASFRRRERPLFLIDLAVPRDIDPATDIIDGVYRYDFDSLEGIAGEAMQQRRRDLDLCNQIVSQAATDFSHWLNGASQRTAGAHSSLPGFAGAQSRPTP